MITGAQMRAARALLGIDQRQLAELSGVSLPTIQRMENSAGNVRGIVETLTKVVEALDAAGVELIGENVRSVGDGRGVRMKQPAAMSEAVFGQKYLRRRSPSSRPLPSPIPTRENFSAAYKLLSMILKP